MRFSKEQALVLYKRPYQDKHEWVTVYMNGLGKASFLAYGSRSLKSRFRGVLEPLHVVELSVAETDHYRTIKEAKKLHGFGNIGAHLSATYHAYYVLELLHHFLTEEEDDLEVFGLVLETLSCIEQECKPALASYYFALQLCTRKGFFPKFSHCSSCDRKLDGLVGSLSMEDSAFTCSECRSSTTVMDIPFRYVKLFSFLQRSTLEEVLALKMTPADKEMLERFLSQSFSYVTSRELQTEKVLAGFSSTD